MSEQNELAKNASHLVFDCSILPTHTNVMRAEEPKEAESWRKIKKKGKRWWRKYPEKPEWLTWNSGWLNSDFHLQLKICHILLYHFKMPLAICQTLSHWLRGLLSWTVQLEMVQVPVLVTFWGNSCWSHDMLVSHSGLSQWLALSTMTVTGSHQQKQLSYQPKLCLSTAPRARPLILQSRLGASIAFWILTRYIDFIPSEITR